MRQGVVTGIDVGRHRKRPNPAVACGVENGRVSPRTGTSWHATRMGLVKRARPTSGR